MGIEHEIRNALDNNDLLKSLTEKGVEMANEIIATKLKPIKEKVESVRTGSSMLTFKADAILKEILAMLDAS